MNIPESETIKETAKAVQEASKLGSKVVDAAEKTGRFVARVVGGPLEMGIGIWEDRLRYARWERQMRLMQRADEFLSQVKLKEPTRILPLNFAVPLLQAATLEEDDDLQDIWAALLVNAANAGSGIDLRRAYIDILQSLTPLEANILAKIYSVELDLGLNNSVLTSRLPEEISLSSSLSRDEQGQAPEPSDDIKLGLANLTRLGCISLGTTWDGNQIFREVFHTILGKKFIEACTLVIQ